MDSHWSPAPSNINLPLDKDIYQRLAQKDTSLLVVHGMTGIGKSHTHGRLSPELTKAGWALRDLSVGEDVNAVLRSVWSERKPTILFIDSIPWERFQKGKKSKDLPAGIHHRVNKDDATSFTRNLLDHYEEVRDLPGLGKHLWADHAQHGSGSLVGRLLRLSRWFDGEHEVYLPCAIVANLHDFLEKSKLHKDTLPQEIQGAVSNYKRELSNQEANLQILSAALTGGVALGTAWGPALAGIAALTPVLLGLGLAAASVSIYTFFSQRKQQKKNVPVEVEHWVKAVTVWNILPEWRRDLICYDIDRHLGAPLGSARASMTKMAQDQDPRKTLLRGIEELLGSPSGLQRVKEALGVEDVEETLDEVKETLTVLGARVTKTEQRLDNHELRLKSAEAKTGIMGSARRVTSGTLHSIPRFARFGDRPPLISEVHRQHIESVIQAIGEGKKVSILGEAGIGKSSLLYSICRRLVVMGKPVYTDGTGGLPIGSVWFCDDLDGETASQVQTITSSPILATARPEVWASGKSGPPRGWTMIEMTRHDIPHPLLERILLDELEVEEVKSTQEGVDKAVEDSRGLPGFLIEKVRWCKQTGRDLTPDTALRRAPSTVELIEDVIRTVRDTNTLFLLCALAHSKKARLHRVHLQALLRLRDASAGVDTQLPNEFLALTVSESGSVFSLGHDLWRDVIRKPWKSLGSGSHREPEGLLSLRSTGIVESLLNKSFEESPSAIVALRGIESVAAVRVTAENHPGLVREILRAQTPLPSVSHMTSAMEWIAVNFPNDVIAEESAGRAESSGTLEAKAQALVSSGGLLVHGCPSYALLMLQEAEKLILEETGTVPSGKELNAEIYDSLADAFHELGEESKAISYRCKAVDEWRRVCCSVNGLSTLKSLKLEGSLIRLGKDLMEQGNLGGAIQALWMSTQISDSFLHLKLSIVALCNRMAGANVDAEHWVFRINDGREAKAPPIPESNPESEALSRVVSDFIPFYEKLRDSAHIVSAGIPPAGMVAIPDPDKAGMVMLEEVGLRVEAYRNLGVALARADRPDEGVRARLKASREAEVTINAVERDSPEHAKMLRDWVLHDWPVLYRPDDPSKTKWGMSNAAISKQLREVVDEYRVIASKEDQYLPELAESLVALYRFSKEVSGEEDTALAALKEAESIYSSLVNINNRFAAVHARILGMLSGHVDRLRAIDYLFGSLASIELLPSSSPRTMLLRAQMCSKLGGAFFSLGDADKAAKWLQEAELAWAGTTDFPGGGDEEDRFRKRVDDLVLLGTIHLFEKKQPDMAASVFVRVIDLLKQRPALDPKMQVSLVQSLDRLGSARAHVKDYERAIEAYQQAIVTSRKIPRDSKLTPDNLKPVLLEASSLMNLSHMKRDLGRREDALSDLDEAGKVLMSVPQQLDPDGAMILATLGKAYKDLSAWPQSQEWFRTALSQIEIILGGLESAGLHGNPHWLRRWCLVLSDYAAAFQDHQQKERAEVYSQAAAFLRGLKPTTEAVQINLGIVLGNQGQCLLDSGRADEAVKVLREAESIIEPIAEVNPKDQDALDHVRRQLSKALAISPQPTRPSVGDGNG